MKQSSLYTHPRPDQSSFTMRLVMKKFCFIAVGLLLTLGGFSQLISNKGKEFWVGYGHHQFMEMGFNDQNMVLYLSAEDQPATVTVTIDSSGPFPATWWRRTYNIPAYTVISTEPLPKGTIDAGPSGTDPNFDARLYDDPPPAGFGGNRTFTKRAIHIESNVPIVAYAHIYGNVSSGATMLLPVETWGYSYISINSEQVDAGGPGYSWIYVVAKEDNTRVRIIPSAATRLGVPPGTPIDVDLQKGHIYQLIGQSDAGGNGVQLTGTTIKAIPGPDGECHPFAAFAGSSRTRGESVPCGTASGRDNDIAQLFPEHAWGKTYLTAPMSSSNGATLLPNQFQTSIYKIVAKDPATTTVRVNGAVLNRPAGQSYWQYHSNTADYIEADKPIMVAQFISGASACNPGSSGDPSMVYLSPLEQAIKRVGFYRNNKEVIYSNYVTIIVPTDGVPSLRIDNSAVFDHVYAHPNKPGYSVVVKGWPASQSQCLVRCDSNFTAVTYGLGSAESYAYSAGAYFENLNAISELHNVADTTNNGQNVHPFNCVNSPVEISALTRFQANRLVFRVSALGAVVTPNADVVMDPASDYFVGTVDMNGQTYYKYKLPGEYVFNTPGVYTIPVKLTSPAIDNCNNTEDVAISIEVKARPTADFTWNHPGGCVKDTVTFLGPGSTGTYTIAQWHWTFPDATTSGLQNPQHALGDVGDNDIHLRVVTAEGCEAEATKTIQTFAVPTATVTPSVLSVCEGNAITFTASSSYQAPVAIKDWYWDFGNGTTATPTTGDPMTVQFDNYGTYTVKHVAKISEQCVSDTATTTVTIYAKPKPGFSYPAGCLPENGVVEFVDTSSVPDAQTIVSWSWQFGDPNANPGNPNTSDLQHPSHTYTDFGTYDIRLAITTDQGCAKDTTVSAVFNVSPHITFDALNPVCENAPLVLVNAASVTNGVAGTGVYRGPGTDAAGNFNPAAAGPGLHKIYYDFTSTGGCTITDSSTILVHAKPAPSFTWSPDDGCLPADGLVTFTNTSTIADAQTMTFLWNFDDPNATGTNPNVAIDPNPQHYFSEGVYDIGMMAISSHHCVADTVVSVTLSVTPAIEFTPVPAVCESLEGTILINTAVVTNNVSGTGSYRGPGIDAAGNFSPSLAGAGQHKIYYDFISTGGCTATDSIIIEVYPKPNVEFTFGSGCLPTDGIVTFVNNSSIAGGGPLTFSWNFGDPNANAGNPNTSDLPNPTHIYAEGEYNIQLSAQSANGCAADTTIVATFSVTPQLAWDPLAAVCESVPGTVSLASATVTNNVAGTGVYSGTAIDAAGNFSPSLAGDGTHDLLYTYTSAGGCVAAVSQSVVVHPKPDASFTVNSDICIDQSATITDQSTVPSGFIAAWNWDFGDGTTASNTNNDPFTRNWAAHNTYQIKLTAVSDNGCFDEATRQVVVHPLPVAAIGLPAGVCMPGGMAQFTNLSSVADNSSMTWNWDFGDGSAGSSAAEPVHHYAAVNSYTVTLTATSAYGCVNTTSAVLDDFFDKPIADFAVAPDVLCQGTESVFSNLSTAPNSTVTGYHWNFGDGTTADQANPVKTYALPGQYFVELTVTNAVGCESDPVSKPVTVYLQPVIDAGPSFVVPQGTVVRFNPTVNDSTTVQFTWSPGGALSDPHALRPTLEALYDGTYQLTAVGEGNCTATDFITVKILKPVNIPNAFSPNGDGINDTWLIRNLADYPGCTVEIFNRYGQRVFYSSGYPTPWDGTYNGKPLPVATYYYVIHLKNGFAPVTGSVTIVR